MSGTSELENLKCLIVLFSSVVVRGLLYRKLSKRSEECNSKLHFLQILIFHFYQQGHQLSKHWTERRTAFCLKIFHLIRNFCCGVIHCCPEKIIQRSKNNDRPLVCDIFISIHFCVLGLLQQFRGNLRELFGKMKY